MNLDFLEDMRDYLNSEELENFRKLPTLFKTSKSFSQNLLPESEFHQILSSLNLNLKKEEKKIINSSFSEKTPESQNSGKINTKKFLRFLTGIPNKRRQIFIDKAFFKFDEDGREEILVEDVKSAFNYNVHPLYESGYLSKENVVGEFLRNFPNWEDGVLFREDWNDYFAIVSAAIKEDDHFVVLMKTTWRLE